MSTAQIPMRVRQFATQLQYSMIALVLVSVCPLRALSQDSHNHNVTQQNQEPTGHGPEQAERTPQKLSGKRPSVSGM